MSAQVERVNLELRGAVATAASHPEFLAEALEAELIHARLNKTIDQEAFAAALSALSEVGLPEAADRRSVLARAWKAAADVAIETEGHTPLVVDLLRTASSIDPDDAVLAEAVAFEARRLGLVQERLEHAGRRKAEALDLQSENE